MVVYLYLKNMLRVYLQTHLEPQIYQATNRKKYKNLPSYKKEKVHKFTELEIGRSTHIYRATKRKKYTNLPSYK